MDKLIALLAVFLSFTVCSAKTLTVDDNGPADYQTIQEAINKSWHGDTVVVKPGTYRERVLFNGRRVTLRSEDPDDPTVVQNTVITGQPGASVIFDFGERQDSVLTGFTITGNGILCLATSPTIANNTIRDCSTTGIKGQGGAAPTIIANRILSNKLEGIYSCDGLIQGNAIADNIAGIAFCNGLILDNVISGSLGGGGIYSCDGEIAGNRIVANHAGSYGGGIYSCAGQIHNNIVAGNRADRSGGGLYDCTGAVRNNTIVGNRAVSAGGAMSHCPGPVYNNIIASNAASRAGGIDGPCDNTYNAFWMNQGGNFGSGAATGTGEMVTDPMFVAEGYWNDKGTPDESDDTWVDGDYHVRSQAGRWDQEHGHWATDQTTSHCIDAGKPGTAWQAELWPHGKRANIGAYGGTPQASMSPANAGRPTDLDHNEHVDARDLLRLAENWPLDQELLAEDLNRDNRVDLVDFAILARDWRIAPPPPTPPQPDPMTWATSPYATGPYSIAMVAMTATSTDGTGVEYYFEDFFSPDFNSGWLFFGAGEEPRWEDTGLKPDTLYWYRVKARNRGNQLETGWTQRFGDTTMREDSAAPTPNPMTWATKPYGVSTGVIRMVATTANDDSGVEYQFECSSHPAYTSGWQDSPLYEVTGLPKGHYKFRARARDKSAKHNTTMWSTEVSVDLQPPSPDPMKWESEPKKIQIGTGTWSWHATMTAVEATDESGDVEYYFECTNNSGFSSGWQKERTYTVALGGQHVSAKFRVRARDTSASHNTTGWSSTLPSL